MACHTTLKKHRKEYEGSEEESHRQSTWLDNRAFIEEHNRNTGQHGYTLAMNKFGDLDQQDMKQWKGLLPNKMTKEEINRRLVKSVASNLTLPSSVDWRKKGAVVYVKDQKKCSSCWSFGITGSIEGQNFLRNGKLVALSEQNLIDCSVTQGNMGCKGGYAVASYKYIISNGGIDTEDSYSYKAAMGNCRYKLKNVGATISNYAFVAPLMNETALIGAIANIGPISVIIDTSHRSFTFYNGTGVYYEPKCSVNNIDHTVLAVGYGVQDGKQYYLVKNSWGSDWGDQGYVKMSRNTENNCGIATSPTYPIM